MHHLDLLKVAHVVKDELPGFWIGVNFLDLETQYLFRAVDRKISGVWSDNAEIDETKELQDEASRIKDNRTTSKWQGLYFGGVAFKYQREVADYAKAAKIAVNFVDVVTTSGEGTGHAPNPEKIQEMKQAIGTHPLAIASGISPENISRYTAADAFLVATSLLVRGTEDFDKFKVRDLVAAVR